MGDSIINNSVNKLQFKTNIQENKIQTIDDALSKIVNYSVPLEEGNYRQTGWFDTSRHKEIYTDQLVCNELSSLSDRRFKKNVIRIDDSLEKIKRLRGVMFDWIDEGKKTKGFKKGSKSVGVIAQELEEVIPELVITDKNGFKTVCYEKLPAVLIEGIKDLSDKILVIELELDKLFLNEPRNEDKSSRLVSELKNFEKENGNEYYFNKMKIVENKYNSNFLKFSKQNEELEKKNRVNIKNISKLRVLLEKKESELLKSVEKKDEEIAEIKKRYEELEETVSKMKRNMMEKEMINSRLLGGENSGFLGKNKKKIIMGLIVGLVVLFLVYKFDIYKKMNGLKMKFLKK